MRVALLVALVFFATSSVEAAVRINEIGWMGIDGTGGGSCEWIELYNDGPDTVDLSTWTIFIQNPGSSKELVLGDAASRRFSGIASNGYYYVARSTSSCVHPVQNDLIDWLGSFGNGIGNDGATLTLKQGSEVIDTVDASEGWDESGVGGTNTTPKKTPQYTGMGWYEAAPTPRSANAVPEEPELPEDDDDEPGPTVVTVGGTTPLTPVVNPVPDLRLSSVPSRIVVVGAHTPYTVVVYDDTGKIRNEADVSWSFGDGGSKRGRRAEYAYREAGTYTLAVRASAKGVSVVSLVQVTAVPAELSVEASPRGIVLKNASDRILDLSSWKLKSGDRSFKLPEDTVILGGGSTLFPSEVTRLATSTEVAILYPDGQSVLTLAEPPQ